MHTITTDSTHTMHTITTDSTHTVHTITTASTQAAPAIAQCIKVRADDGRVARGQFPSVSGQPAPDSPEIDTAQLLSPTVNTHLKIAFRS